MKTNENNASAQEKNEVIVVENPALMNTAKVIDRILKVFQVIAVACMIVAAVFIPLTLIFGEKVIADASRLETGCLRIVFTGDMSAYLDMDGVKLNIVMALVSAIIPLAVGWYCIRVLRGILAPMKEGRAFAEGISRKIKKLGWTALIGGGLVEIARIAEDFFFVRAYRLDEIISHPSVESVGAAFGPGSVHPWFIFAALVMFFLSFVFRCGEELQRQSDETL